MVHGFLDDFVAAMEYRGGLAPPVRYGKTFTRVHDPLMWREAADALLTEAGVEIVYHSTVVGALVEGGEKIEGVTAYTKEGSATIRAKVTIDASGDADVVAMAGFPSFIGQDGRVQNPTMIFRLMGVDTRRFLAAYGDDTIMGEEVSALIREKAAGNAYKLPRAKIWLFTTTRPSELLCNCTRVIGADGRELNTLFSRDFTEAEIEGRLPNTRICTLLPRQSRRLRGKFCKRHGRAGWRATDAASPGRIASAQCGYPQGCEICRWNRALAMADRTTFGCKAPRGMAARRRLRGSVWLFCAGAR